MVRNDAFPGLDELMSEDFGALESALDNAAAPLSWHEDDCAGDRFNTYLNVIHNPLFMVDYREDD